MTIPARAHPHPAPSAARPSLIPWLRVAVSDLARLDDIKQDLGIDMLRVARDGRDSPSGNLGDISARTGACSVFPLTFLSLAEGRKTACRVVFALGRQTLVSLEPDAAIAPLAAAQARLAHEAGTLDACACLAVVLQAINDATDALLDALGDELGAVLVQTNAVLNSLEARDRDFGVSDVVAAQMELGSVEELLSDGIEAQLQLAQTARQVLARLPAQQDGIKPVFLTLIEDIEAVEEHIGFVHDRVRLLQTTNNMALNVKQNQIIKVFSVVTAVFLPAMLISTFYSMNIINMPALTLPYGEPLIIVLTAVFSLLPLIYVKRRGWLR